MKLEKLNEQTHFRFEKELLEEINQIGKIKRFEANEIVIDLDQKIEYFPLILDGSIKIHRENEKGEDVFLYYLEPGDTCSMSLTCCLGNKKSEIIGITTSQTKILFIPVHILDEWMAKYKSWRFYILETYNTRLNEFIEAVDSFVFDNMEERVEKYLVNMVKTKGDNHLTIKHLDIANDLNSSRVVMSRVLKLLEKKGVIKMSIKQIEVLKW